MTNEEVRSRFKNAIGVHDGLLTMVKKWKLTWYVEDSSAVKGERNSRKQKNRWEDKVEEWTGMQFGDSLRAAEDRERWKVIVAVSSVVPRRPSKLRDWDEMRCNRNTKLLTQLLRDFERAVIILSFSVAWKCWFQLLIRWAAMWIPHRNYRRLGPSCSKHR